VQVNTNGPVQTYTLVGTMRIGTADSLLGATVTAFDTPTAQKAFDLVGRYSAITAKAASGVSDTELRDRINRALGGRYEAVTGTQLAKQDASDVQKGISFFSTFLLVFAGVSLLVGTFLIVNTFNIIVAQRTRELALLRALGARRRQVMASVVGEAVITGTLCSIVGVGFGVVTAIGLQGLFSAIGFKLPSAGLIIHPSSVIVGLVVGFVVTLLSSLLPGRRATRVAPVEALRDVAAPPATSARSRVIAGSAMGIVGGAALAAGLLGSGISLVGLGALLIFLAVAFLAPLIARPVAGFIGAPIARLYKLPGRLARENAVRNPRRTAATAAALMIGLALVTLVTILSSSAQVSTNRAIDRAFTADYIVKTKQFGPFPATLARDLRQLPEIAAVSPFSFGQFKLDGSKKQVSSVDPREFAKLGNLRVLQGALPRDSDPAALLVDEKTAKDKKWHAGTVVTLEFAKTGKVPLPIKAVYAKNQLIGAYLVTDATFRANFTQQFANVVLAKKAPSADDKTARAAVNRVAAKYPSVEVRDQTELKAEQRKQINTFLRGILVLLVFSVAIALIGVINTLVLSIYERTRELGLLRAVGMTRRQIRKTIRWESVIIAVFGTLLGMAVGIGFGAALVAALHGQGITDLVIPFGYLISHVIIAVIAGMGAAIWPAYRASRLNVLTAISNE
jgi:putative ABC transport system permease protein